MSSVVKNIFFLMLFSVLLSPSFSQQAYLNNFLQGKAKLESGEFDLSILYLDSALMVKPNDPDALFNKGLVLYSKAQYGMAVQEFEKVEKYSKGEASIWLARSYARLKDTENSIKALEVHLTSNYRLPESTLLLDKDLSILENDPRYIEFWKNGTWYKGFDQMLAEADYLLKSEQYPEAINLLSEGLRKGYRKSPIYAARAEIYIKAGNLKLALDDLNQSIGMDSRNSKLLAKRAEIYYQTGKYKPAMDDYNKALSISPNEIRFNVGRAMSASKSGLYENAKNDLNLYLKYYPENDTAWYQFGMVHFDNENYFEALNCFINSLKINQKDSRYFAARGATYLKTKTYKYAWKDLSMALDLNPNDTQSYLNKGIASLNLGDMNDACFCFGMAKKMGNKEGFNLVEKYCK